MKILLLLAITLTASAWGDVPPDPTQSQLDKLMNYCPENATDNTKVKNCIAVNHESRIDALEGGSNGNTYPLPEVCIVAGAPVQIWVLNGFMRELIGDAYGSRWLQIAANVNIGARNSNSYPWTIGTAAGVQIESLVSPSFPSEEAINGCLDALVPLLGNRVTITN